jgi:hypothetical protein
MIVSNNESQITLRFTDFSTQPHIDVVRVLECKDMRCSQQQQLAELSGTYATLPVVTSTTGFMKVAFTSDGSVNYGGFTASWSFVSACHNLDFHQV